MAISTFQRSEMKFLMDQRQMETLLQGVEPYMRPDAYCKNGGDYTIHNIYYDTWDSALIRASLDKPYHKEKLRLRSYGVPVGPNEKIFVELKKKTGGIVHKRRAILTLQEAEDFLHEGRCPQAEDYINRQVVAELKSFLDSHEVYPAVYIGYRRMAFFGQDDKDFRITFDFDIRTRRCDLSLRKGAYGSQLLPPGRCLMEVKINRAVPMWLAALLSELELYKTSFSKYGEEYTLYSRDELCRPRRSDPKVVVLRPERTPIIKAI